MIHFDIRKTELLLASASHVPLFTSAKMILANHIMTVLNDMTILCNVDIKMIDIYDIK